MRFPRFRKQNKNTDESNKGKNLLKIKLQKFKDLFKNLFRNTNKNNKRENVDGILKHIKKLGSWRENDRKYAANFFANAAEKGQDITLAVDALLCALIMDCDSVREDAVRALTYYYMNKKDENGIMRLLGHKRNDVRENVPVVLANAAEKGQDITLAISALADALRDDDANVRLHAAAALRAAALNGQDITLAISALADALRDKKAYVRLYAAVALRNAALNEQDITLAISALADVLGDERGDVRENGAIALANAAEKGQDIILAVPALTYALRDERAYVRLYAAVALTYHYLNKGNEEELNKLLNHEDPDVRKWTIQAQKAY